MTIAIRPPAPAEAEARFSYSSPDQPRLQQALIRAVERLGGQRRLKRLYDHYRARCGGEDFVQAAVRLLALDIAYDHEAFARIPKTGPLVFVANHPYGVLDGITLAWLARRVRPETRILAHGVLLRVPEMRDVLLPVDFSMTREAQAVNLATRATAIAQLKAGGAVGIFPAGGVSTVPRPLARRALDLAWAPFAAKLVRQPGVHVVPVHFSGQNSRLFQVASHFSETLRLSLLFRETSRRIGTRLDVAIGGAITPAEIAAIGSRNELLAELRRRTYALSRDGGVDWSRCAALPPTRAERRAAAA